MRANGDYVIDPDLDQLPDAGVPPFVIECEFPRRTRIGISKVRLFIIFSHKQVKIPITSAWCTVSENTLRIGFGLK